MKNEFIVWELLVNDMLIRQDLEEEGKSNYVK